MFHTSLCEHAPNSSLSSNKCKEHEQQALLKFKQSFTEDPMNRLSSWIDGDCCQWRGVYCDGVTGNVIKLNLRNQLLPYYGPFKDCISKSHISLTSPGLNPALLGLTELTHLDLSSNDFSGSQIPGFIGSLRQLRYLNLSGAGFRGYVPPQLGYLSNLVMLDLSSSTCDTNDMFSTSLSWASNLSKLRTLKMEGIDLSRANDTMLVLSKLPALTFLSLSDCKLKSTRILDTVNSSTSIFSTLKHLDLSSNWFGGHLTPSFIGNISSLIFLSLGSNNFNGSIPLWLRSLVGLEYLDLSQNAFKDVEGNNVWGLLGNPCNFKHLDLQRGQIQGHILKPATNFSRCPTYKLEYLDLAYNNLGGTLPSFLGDFTKLKHLELSNNGFEGFIPSSLAGLSALNYLGLSNNLLSGVVTDFLGNFTDIEALYLSSLTLQGILSSSIANFSKLSALAVSCNTLDLSSNFEWRPRFQLKYFRMSPCGREIEFPKWLKNQTQIQTLDLAENSMLGEFPNWVWNMTNLSILDLAGNYFTGSITNLSPNLEVLDVSNNFLNGSLPQHIHYHSLKFFYLHNNMLSGAIPSWLSNNPKINRINLSSNWLSGKVFEEKNGSSLLMSPSLLFIDFSNNDLSGKIQLHYHEPTSVSQLYGLILRENRLSGQIPSELCSLASLTIIDFAENQFRGHIPPCFGSFMSYEDSLSGYGYNVSVTIKRRKEEITSKFQAAPNIDLSRNFLNGEIPDELTNLSKLIGLNLSYNQLTGRIPERIGNMKKLESLDLSNNRLFGTIPQSLSNINGLASLNLSNNNLQGHIPTGNQLQTLDDPSIYTGNPGLCGFPLPNKCSMNPQATPEEGYVEEEDKNEKMWFYLVIMAGVATGFWGFVGILVLKKRWRVAYFRFVEDTMAKCKLA